VLLQQHGPLPTSARSQTNLESSVSEIVSLCGEWFFRTDPDKRGEGDFPFRIVQLPNYGKKENHPTESDWAELREAQLMALRLPNTGLAVTIDLGKANDVHPHKKAEVGQRLTVGFGNNLW